MKIRLTTLVIAFLLFFLTDAFGQTERRESMFRPVASVCRISSDDFNELLFRNKEVAKAFIKLLSGNLMDKEQELLNLAYNSVAKRVADGLISLKTKYQEPLASLLNSLKCLNLEF